MKLDLVTIDSVVESALREDLGTGDVTTEAVLDRRGRVRARIEAREPCVLAGVEIVERTFHHLDPKCRFQREKQDGGKLSAGETVIGILAEAGAVLAGERTALNFLQHLSGIASRVDEYLRKLDGTGAILLDTRKTTPGLRLLEKYAVRVGGARNHRMGLFDGILIKENHLALIGGAAETVHRARRRLGRETRIGIEVRSLEEFEEAARSGADILLLDNMSPEEVGKCVERKQQGIRLEASGGMRPANIRNYAVTGVDRISAGGLIHSATWVDFSLKVEGWAE